MCKKIMEQGRCVSEAGETEDCSDGKNRRQGWGFIQEQHGEPSHAAQGSRWALRAGEGLATSPICDLPQDFCLQKPYLPLAIMGDSFNIWFKIRKVSTMQQFIRGHAEGPCSWACVGNQKPRFREADALVGQCSFSRADLIDCARCPKVQSWFLSSAGGGQKQNCSIWRNKWIINLMGQRWASCFLLCEGGGSNMVLFD